MFIGFLAKKYDLLQKFYLPPLVFALLVWVLAVFNGYGYLSFIDCRIDLISIIVTFCACYVVLMISKLFEKSKLLCRFFTWIGRNTIIILCFHMFELYTGLLDIIAKALFPSVAVDAVFFIRMVWCLFFAFVIPKIPVVRKVFSL